MQFGGLVSVEFPDPSYHGPPGFPFLSRRLGTMVLESPAGLASCPGSHPLAVGEPLESESWALGRCPMV